MWAWFESHTHENLTEKISQTDSPFASSLWVIPTLLALHSSLPNPVLTLNPLHRTHYTPNSSHYTLLIWHSLFLFVHSALCILTDFALCSTRICALWTLHLCRLCTFIFEHSALGSSIFFSSSHLTSLKFALYTLPLYTLHLYLLSLHLFCTLLLTLHSTYTYTSTQGQTPLQTSIFLMLRNCTTLCPTSLDSATQIQSTTCSHTK